MNPHKGRSSTENPSRIEVGIATRALPGDTEAPCGDIGFTNLRGDRRLAGLIDGLGHGERAHDIATRAREAIEHRVGDDESLSQIFERIDQTFRGDRGFVAALCSANARTGKLEFCGIGNITTRLFTDHETTLLSGQGIVGQHSARPKLRMMPFPLGGYLVLHTDGMSSHLHAEQLLEHRHRTAAQAAGALLETHARSNDDCGVVVVRHCQ